MDAECSLLPYPSTMRAVPFRSERAYFSGRSFSRSGVSASSSGWPSARGSASMSRREGGWARSHSDRSPFFFASTRSSVAVARPCPEFWLAFFEVGTAYWILDAARVEEGPEAIRSTGWAGLFFLLALNVKTTALGLAVPVALLPLVFVRRTARGPALRSLVIGALAGWTLSGLLLNNIGNLARWKTCSRLLVSAPSSGAISTPVSSTSTPRGCRSSLGASRRSRLPRGRPPSAGRGGGACLGATSLISSEDSPWSWPGRFHFTVLRTARIYSLGGISGCRDSRASLSSSSSRRGERGPRPGEPLFPSAPSRADVARSSRVRSQLDGPKRSPRPFLDRAVGRRRRQPRALASRFAAAHRGVAVLAALLVGFQAVVAFPDEWQETRAPLKSPTPEVLLDEPFSGVLPPFHQVPDPALRPSGSRDYPLFRPREGFSNR